MKDHAGQVTDQVREAPAAVSRQIQGNPIAAGLIAFSAGLLAASLLPTTDVEQWAARRLRAGDLVEPVRDQLMESAQSIRDDLGGNAKDVVASHGRSPGHQPSGDRVREGRRRRKPGTRRGLRLVDQ